MNESVNIRGLVLSKYHSISEFAKAIGWSRNKASRMLNGVTALSADDMAEMSALLGIKTPENFVHYFFAGLSTKWTDRNSA